MGYLIEIYGYGIDHEEEMASFFYYSADQFSLYVILVIAMSKEI